MAVRMDVERVDHWVDHLGAKKVDQMVFATVEYLAVETVVSWVELSVASRDA